MVWRRRVIFTRSSRAASSAGTGARGAGAGAVVVLADGADLAAAAAFCTSSFMIRPSRPVPFTWLSSRPASAIAFLAEGACSTSLPCAPVASGFASALAAGAAAPAPPWVITASLPPASTVAPSSNRISAITPPTGAGTSTDTLSVSSSHSISSADTVSPTFLNQVDTVASVTLSPRLGTITSTDLPDFGALLLAGSSLLAGLSAFFAGAGASPSPSLKVASSASTPTVSPSAAMISPKTPAAGAGTSTVTLSVSSSQSISSATTASPGFLNQVATVASVTLSPRVGTRTSMLMGQFPSIVSASDTSASCCALCWLIRPVAGEAEAGRPT